MKYVRLLLPILGLALGVGAFYFGQKAIYIGEVTCRSQFGPCTLLGDKLSGLSGGSLYDTRREVRSFLTSQDSISHFSIQFKIPDTLRVAIIEKKPKFALKDSTSGFFALVDKEGKVLKIVEESYLPQVVSADKLPNVGEKIKEEYLFALNIIYNVFASYQAREGRIEGSSLVVNIPQGFKVIFPLKGDKDTLLGALRLLIERLNVSSKDTRINEAGVSQIDLRFKNPVLK